MKKMIGTVGKKKALRNLILLAGVFAAFVAVCVSLFLWYYGSYMNKLLYAERLKQMEEVTGQLFNGLEDVINEEWNEADIYCNYLELGQPKTLDELTKFVGKQAKLNNLETKRTDIVGVDEQGRYYTQDGSQGTLAEMDYLLEAPERVSFVSKSLTEGASKMYFLYRLKNPVTVQTQKGKITLIYYGLSRNMDELNAYFSCDAYDGNNTVYVINSVGEKLFSGNNSEILQGYNVNSVLKEMTYLHGTSFEDAQKELERTGKTYSNVVLDDKEYYYALYKMEQSHWTLLFMVPSEYVATNTVRMMNTTTLILLIFAAIFLVVTISMIVFLLHTKQKLALDTERSNNERLAELNEKLEAAVKAADSASKAKSDFLANMSHDIRTPMNAIVGITNLMEHEKDDPEKLDAYIHKVQSSSHHLLSLINDILDMSKIESGEVVLNLEPMNLAEQIGQIDSIVRSQIEEHNQSFTVRVHEISHEFLIGDAVRVRQVFINLLSNAVKYTPSGGAISLDVAELDCTKPGYARFSITVTDNGYGMSQEFLKHIFEPFVRAENSTTNRVQGTGLGMAITKNIVDRMNGTITVESELGKGSRFDVDFTLAIDTNVECRLPVQKVLLLSGEEMLTKNVRASFKETDAEFRAVRTMEEAVVLLKEQSFDTVLLGGFLHDPSLVDMIKTLHENSKDAALVICCDYADAEKVYHILKNSGADGLISRPFFLSNFIRTLGLANDEVEQTLDDTVILRGKRFLCAEDNELNAEILKAILEMEGAECTICVNGQEIVDAFKNVKQGEYDAILMDVQMPVMNGLNATRAIRRGDNPLGQTIPIIAMTANAFSSDVQACLDAGMNAHVAKPLDIEVLARTIKSLQTDLYFRGGQLYARHRREVKQNDV